MCTQSRGPGCSRTRTLSAVFCFCARLPPVDCGPDPLWFRPFFIIVQEGESVNLWGRGENEERRVQEAAPYGCRTPRGTGGHMGPPLRKCRNLSGERRRGWSQTGPTVNGTQFETGG